MRDAAQVLVDDVLACACGPYRDDGKGALEGDEKGVRDAAQVLVDDVFEPRQVGPADHRVGGRPLIKADGVPDEHPQQGDDTHDGKRVHHRREDVRGLREAAVEECQPGDGHQEHKVRAQENEGLHTDVRGNAA